MEEPSIGFKILPSTGRLLALLAIVACLGVDMYVARKPQLVTPEKASAVAASPLPTPSSTDSGSSVPTPNPTARPVATPTAIVETTYQTSGGLRYADRDLYQKELAQASAMAEADAALRSFLGEYGVGLWTTSDTLPSTTQLNVTWDHLSQTSPSDLADTKTFGSWFIDEWSKYPKEWVKVSNVQTVALVKNLVNLGAPEWGEATPLGILFVQVTPLSSLGATSEAEDYLRGIIQHEFDHEIEFAVHGSPNVPDPAWSGFNPPGFAYGSVGNVTANSAHPGPAFVTLYAETAIGEDKAEAYSYLFVDARYKLLQAWTRTDPELAGKVAEYEAFIKSEVPIMDGTYFAAINP